MKINRKELEQILEDHKKWLDDEEGGVRANLVRASLDRASLDGANLVRANLDGANLYGANLVRASLDRASLDGANLDGANLVRASLDRASLYGANLYDCSGNRGEIKSLFVSEVYPITYTAKHLQIGCEKHLIKDWWSFSDEKIKGMEGGKALNFWNEWKDTIKAIIEKSPAKEIEEIKK